MNYASRLVPSRTEQRAMQQQMQRIVASLDAAHRELARYAPLLQRANADLVASMRGVWAAWRKTRCE